MFDLQLTHFLSYEFLIHVMVSHYIYIYDLEFNWIQTLRFSHPIIHLPQKLKN